MNQAKSTAPSLNIEHTTSPFRYGMWDHMGLGLSGLCAVHCLVLPFLLILLPLSPALGALHAWLHPLFAAFILPVTVQAMRGHRHRKSRAAPLLLVLGLLFVLLAFPAHDLLGERSETLFTLLGSGLLLSGHLLNVRRCRKEKGSLA